MKQIKREDDERKRFKPEGDEKKYFKSLLECPGGGPKGAVCFMAFFAVASGIGLLVRGLNIGENALVIIGVVLLVLGCPALALMALADFSK